MCSAGRVAVNVSIYRSLLEICQILDHPSTAIVQCTTYCCSLYKAILCILMCSTESYAVYAVWCFCILHVSLCVFLGCMACVLNLVSLHRQRLNCWRPVCWQLKNSRSSKKQLLEWRFNRVPLISRSDFSWWYTCDGLCQSGEEVSWIDQWSSEWWSSWWLSQRSQLTSIVKLYCICMFYIFIGWYWFETLRCLLCYGMSYFGKICKQNKYACGKFVLLICIYIYIVYIIITFHAKPVFFRNIQLTWKMPEIPLEHLRTLAPKHW